MPKKTVLVLAVIVLLIIVIAIFAFLWAKNNKVETAQKIIEQATSAAIDTANTVNNTIQKATDAVNNLPNTNPYKKVNPF